MTNKEVKGQTHFIWRTNISCKCAANQIRIVQSDQMHVPFTSNTNHMADHGHITFEVSPNRSLTHFFWKHLKGHRQKVQIKIRYHLMWHLNRVSNILQVVRPFSNENILINII